MNSIMIIALLFILAAVSVFTYFYSQKRAFDENNIAVVRGEPPEDADFEEAVQREARMMQQAREAGVVLAPTKQKVVISTASAKPLKHLELAAPDNSYFTHKVKVVPAIKLIRNDSGWFRRTFERSRKK